jgi:Villin headpiece domain
MDVRMDDPESLHTLIHTRFPAVPSPPPQMYLTDEEFEQLFKIKRSAYLRLPGWKQVKLKEKAGFRVPPS